MVEINGYFKSRDGEKKVSPHFRVREFACKDGSDVVFIAPKLLEVLEQIRDHYRKPIIINSGYRTVTHNSKEGGSPHSQHLLGVAADIVVDGISPARVAKFARSIMKTYGGVGKYNSFTHIDVREIKANW